MLKTRIGNDITLQWTVTRGGNAVNLNGVASIKLYAVAPMIKQELYFSVGGVGNNVITTVFYGKDQMYCGSYRLQLVCNEGRENMFTLDSADAVVLAPVTDTATTVVQTVSLTSDIILPSNGLSAYDIAVLHGYTGTEEQWLADYNNAISRAVSAAVAAETSAERCEAATPSAQKVQFMSEHGLYGIEPEGELEGLVPNVMSRICTMESTLQAVQSGMFYGYYPTSTALPTGDAPGYAYVGESAPFKIYCFKWGAWSDSLTTQNSVIIADNDDLEQVSGKLQLKNHSGYTILRSSSSLATQMSEDDTIYEIKYDFNLNGSSLTIPSGSCLFFNGGSIYGGSIVFDDTELAGQVSFSNITPSGTIANHEIPVEWFGWAATIGLSLSNHIISINSDQTVSADTHITSSISNVVFEGNGHHITHTNGAFIAVDGAASNVVVRNFVYTGTTSTSFFESTSAAVTRSDIEICGNTINTCKLGISCNSDESGESLRFNVHNNRIIMNNSSQAIGTYGIHLANCNNSRFWQNYISGSNRHAFYHAWGHDNEIFANTLEENWQITGNPDGVRGCMYIGRDSYNVRVYDNYFHNSKNVMLHIYAGEYDSRRCKVGCRNIEVYGNKFLEEKAYKLPMVMVGYESYTGSYDTVQEMGIAIKDNIFSASTASVTFVRIDSGLDIEVSGNSCTFGSSTSNNTYAIGMIFCPYQASRIGAVSILRNMFNIYNRSNFSAYRWIGGASVSSEKITISGNVYPGYRKSSGLSYTMYEDMSLANFPNVEPTSKTCNSTAGVTGQRPINVEAGYCYFDTTVGKPIWWTGAAWCDATGASV